MEKNLSDLLVDDDGGNRFVVVIENGPKSTRGSKVGTKGHYIRGRPSVVPWTSYTI